MKQHLRTEQVELLSLGAGGIEEQRLEDYIVSGLVDYDDISYDDHADLLYELAAQVVNHFRGYLSEDDVRNVVRYHQKSIAQFVHAQMAPTIYMLEPKSVGALQDAEVLAKRDVAERWCKQASEYAGSYGGKPWQYALIPHDAISENMTLAGLARHYGVGER
ncbi:MAG TPA: hypothetical protein VJ783_09730 [Pirellulales bacterium]|nr:hypothetical protein [Pirellulales bacterium]